MRSARRIHAIVVGAGRGTRLGLGPKAFVQVGGRRLLDWSISLMDRHVTGELVVVVPDDLMHDAVESAPPTERLTVVAGADTRAGSVLAGLDQLVRAEADEDDLVMVHDAARPLQTDDVVAATIRAAQQSPAAAPAIEPASMVRVMVDGQIQHSLDRADLRLVQTPQVASLGLLQQALNDVDVPDELEAIAKIVGWDQVALVRGDARGRKVTSADDLALVDAIARNTIDLSTIDLRAESLN